MIDAREGITYNDVALYNWLNSESLKLASDSSGKKRRSRNSQPDEPLVTIEDLEKVSEVNYSIVD